METYLLLGSNLGDRLGNLKSARDYIGESIARIIKASSIYETEPWGDNNQPLFLNQVIMIETSLKPEMLLKKLKSVESRVGRAQTEKWGPRIIDIDILLMDELVYRSDSLTVPHPQMHNRRFALVPLAEIAPAGIHPQFNLTAEELLVQCDDKLNVTKLKAGIRSF